MERAIDRRYVTIPLSGRRPTVRTATSDVAGEGCGHELDSWLKKTVSLPLTASAKPTHNMRLAAMPKQCRAVVNAP
jgi:murein endopeptidase